ncbi:DUF1573 domain-containing protein [Desulfatitalea sp. M08but]|uniref:DUF1573 domain-containing protein n=2 Tax=Desulfatitalea alkaliphila TaxID=2929485 RepID=A0AA41R1S5_9BACT|nr:DUF1573 domain-containing protein [Desulfatitalea alkaliphila]
MTRIFNIGLWAASLFISLFVTGIAVADVPRLALTEERHQFETVVEGVAVLHDFVIRNGGTAELQIERVESG